MDFHPVASIFPMMSDDEYSALVADIRLYGQREPVYVYEDKILDGRNRWRACDELGISAKTTTWDGDGSPVDFVVSLNLHRRHLNETQRGMVAEKLATLGEGRPKTTQICVVSISQAAELMRVSPRSVNSARVVRREGTPELIAECEAGKTSLNDAVRQIERGKRQQAALTAPAVNHDDCRVVCGDFVDVARGIPDNSIDAIITDPPYPEEYVRLAGPLAEIAARILKPGGSLLAMYGQSYLPEIIAQLGAHLRYQWTLCYYTPGPATQLYARHVNSSWKPVLWFVKDEYTGLWVQDVIRSEARDKDHHDWGQSVSGTAELVERFTRPGDLIFDPFTGGGTTGVVAAQLKRRFIGSDIDDTAARIARARITETISSDTTTPRSISLS